VIVNRLADMNTHVPLNIQCAKLVQNLYKTAPLIRFTILALYKFLCMYMGARVSMGMTTLNLAVTC